jgi:hypothetical protein
MTGFLTGQFVPANDSVTASKLSKTAISGQTEVTIAAGDSIMLGDVGDSNNLKRDTVQGILDLAGIVVQHVYTTTGAVATGTTVVPNDDTVPTNSEGVEYMTRAITPTNASNILRIDVVAMFSLSINGDFSMAMLFQDSTSAAIASMMTASASVGTQSREISFSHFMAAGTTSSTTFKVRLGQRNSGTLTFNGEGGNRLLGGNIASSISITEYAV